MCRTVRSQEGQLSGLTQPGMLTFKSAIVVRSPAGCDDLMLLYSSSWLCAEQGRLQVIKRVWPVKISWLLKVLTCVKRVGADGHEVHQMLLLLRRNIATCHESDVRFYL